MKILGIDPGTSRVGYGLIESGQTPKLIDYGVLEAKEKDLIGKIDNISGQLKRFLDKARPDLVAIEKIFFAKNQKTAIAVAQARGALLSLCLQKNIPTVEYSPTEVKSQVAGYGFADKKGVAKMVKAILKIKEMPGYDDAIDAVAIAIAASNQQKLRNIS